MGSTTFIFFMSVDRQDIVLPVLDWMEDNIDLGKLFEEADKKQSKNDLFTFTEKYGRHLYDILKVK